MATAARAQTRRPACRVRAGGAAQAGGVQAGTAGGRQLYPTGRQQRIIASFQCRAGCLQKRPTVLLRRHARVGRVLPTTQRHLPPALCSLLTFPGPPRGLPPPWWRLAPWRGGSASLPHPHARSWQHTRLLGGVDESDVERSPLNDGDNGPTYQHRRPVVRTAWQPPRQEYWCRLALPSVWCYSSVFTGGSQRVGWVEW